MSDDDPDAPMDGLRDVPTEVSTDAPAIDDAFAARLRDHLVVADVDAITAARLRRAAHAALAAGPPRRGWRWLEASVGTTLAVAQLAWAVSAVLGVYR